MYFRRKKTPSGQVLQLLESYRNRQGQPRQRVVVSLGNAQIPRKNWSLIAKAVEKRLYAYEELFNWDYSRSVECWIDSIVKRIDREGRWQPLQKFKIEQEETKDRGEEVIDGVLVGKCEHTSTSLLGPLLIGWHVWRELEMDKCLAELGFNPTQRKVAAVNVINRLADPVSEHALMEWLGGTALPELLDAEIMTGAKDRFYRISDKLLANQESLERHLRGRTRELFGLERTIMLYDLTNTYFEGKAEKNDKACRGKSKHKRNDCPQIVVGMVFDCYGFELAHRIFEGNRNDSTTLVEMLKELQEVVKDEEDLFLARKPLVIVDAGVATRKNLDILCKQGFNYLVNDSRKGRALYREDFLNEEGFETISGREDKSVVRAKKIRDTVFSKEKVEENTEEEWVVLCKSTPRREKEEAIRSKSEERLVEDLKRLAKRIKKGQLKDLSKIERAIGRLLGKYPRVARFYRVKVEKIKTVNKEERSLFSDYQVIWNREDEQYQKDDELLGCYVLRTDYGNIAAAELWRLYMTLTRAEEGFRSLKSDLGLRPNPHHLEQRVDAHVFITVLAYHLLQYILHALRSKGDTRSWKTLKRVLQTHCYTTIILPTKEGEVHRIRKAGLPEESQKAIYRALNVRWKNLPTTKIKTLQKIPTTL